VNALFTARQVLEHHHHLPALSSRWERIRQDDDSVNQKRTIVPDRTERLAQ
jgi:hypothetical protein